MNQQQLQSFVNLSWEESIVPTLVEYIKIPNKSPQFDPKWQEHGYMQQAVELMKQWCLDHPVAGMQLEVIQAENRTPIIYIDIPGTEEGTILLYGHLDKQPEMTGWDADLGPWKPVLKNDRLYGRGGADDGYAIFAALTAVRALHDQNIAHPRCVIIIEACEESGSDDLPYYIDQLQDRLGKPELIICLDSGCGNYNQLWCTTSLRGVINGEINIEVLTEGVHSGNAGGIVPTTTLVLRQLLARIEDEHTGEIFPQQLKVSIPAQRLKQVAVAANALKNQVYSEFPWKVSTQPLSNNLEELILNRTWRAALSITGAEGLPALENAGNVLLPKLAVKFALRIPPTCNIETASTYIKTLLETKPPFDAHVKVTIDATGPGWNAPDTNAELAALIDTASQNYFGKPCAYMGEGGSIPFMGMLGEKFPHAQFLITGVLGPHSNAHGPNEFLHIPTGKSVTCCVAEVIGKFKK